MFFPIRFVNSRGNEWEKKQNLAGHHSFWLGTTHFHRGVSWKKKRRMFEGLESIPDMRFRSNIIVFDH